MNIITVANRGSEEDALNRRSSGLKAGWEFALPALLFVCTLLISSYFAAGGRHSGFIDMGHDGYNLREALDLSGGATLFRDTYEQYGPLGPYLNLAGFELFGSRLLAIRYAMCVCYGLIAILLYRVARHLLDPVLSALSVVVWLLTAPFYQQGIMISVHVYVLFAQAAATLALLNRIQGSGVAWLVIAGMFCGISCILKQSVGFLFAVAVALYYSTRVLRGNSTVGAAVRDFSIFSLSSLSVVVAMLGFLWGSGALPDWYRQTILFPRQFYLGSADAAMGPLGSLLSFPTRFLGAHLREQVTYDWYLMRAVLAGGALVMLWNGKTDSKSDKLVIVTCLTIVLWAAAYPSSNFMHQWWMMSIGVSAFVYCEYLAIDWALGRFTRHRSFARALTVAATFLVLWPGVRARMDAGITRSTTPYEVIAEPWVISGIRTDTRTYGDLRSLRSAIENFRKHHQGARLVSIDGSDGWLHGVAESLLWLSLVDGNTHHHPVYWSMPVLSTHTYPDYQAQLREEIARTRPLLGESRIGPFKPQSIDGYYLLLGLRTARGSHWYLYAPTHDELAMHGEEPVLTGIEPEPEPAKQVVVAKPEDRDLYKWPEGLELSDSLPQQLESIDGSTTFHDSILQFSRPGWDVDGVAAQPFSYLLQTSGIDRHKGDLLVARGELDEGGFTLGLQKDGRWVGSVNVLRPGKFAVVLQVPADGRYQVVLANCIYVSSSSGLRRLLRLSAGELYRNRFRVTSAGWSTEP